MEFLKKLRNDEELNDLRKEYVELFNTSPVPYNMAKDQGIDEYKNKIREAINKKEKMKR